MIAHRRVVKITKIDQLSMLEKYDKDIHLIGVTSLKELCTIKSKISEIQAKYSSSEMNITEIAFDIFFNEIIYDPVVLPSTLVSINYGYQFNQALVKNTTANGLKIMSFDRRFDNGSPKGVE